MISDLDTLRRAIEQNQIVPCFQPLTALRSGKITGFELLSRWLHPDWGLVLPENFIPLAEQNGLIWELTQQVMSKAFAAASLLASPLLLSVNISPLQLRDATLVNGIRDLAEAGDFPLDRLMIEITESAMVTDLSRALVVANELRAMGCKLALDDFGTGYSSLAQLQVLPFNELKIDRVFINAMMKTRESRKIVASIIGLGHSLGLVTVAEGVETEAQADMLIWLGCEQAQGWLYGKAVPIDEITGFVVAAPRPISPGMASPGEGWASSNLQALPAQRLSQLQAIYDGAPVGLCFLDRNLRYISLNQRLADINEIPLVDHIGKTVAEVLPELFPRIEAYLARVLKGESISETDISIPPKSDNDLEKTLRVTYYPAFDEADEVIGISVAVLDVTGEKNVGDLPMAGAGYATALANQTTVLTNAVDALAQTVQASSGWVRSIQEIKAYARNLGWMEALHPDDLEPTINTIKAALETKAPVDIEYRVGDFEDKWKWMRSKGVPRFGPTGEVVRWYGTVEEIHDLKVKADQQMPGRSSNPGT
ncbi:EAL domain-containing protein (putative c-di-GMP-specific phosphodiesterase class I) [Granulicella aggregans]|uniref:EAL domain-containing protein (Putative c-di-GMP-specific phosphodiesterase class I) n=1 Tax=Granulicella aggregans TaxID=474949 RepID=A0A7W8E475_9BACT|nr:EAL domain-containing protein [Granulicella aggregans]MBB5058337.1 EAL domain-containing protein (putative c-di-GMP-specific phosphodiesterase class I) [Granulicella aggregans]